MSGATMAAMGGTNRRTFGEEAAPRRSFGTRVVMSHTPLPARSVDRNVADLRRRIGATTPMPSRLPLAVGAAVITGLSLVLWMDAFQVATTLAHRLASAF